jgi:hypothetical protein
MTDHKRPSAQDDPAADFRQGQREGRLLQQSSQPLPALSGGAYAVGLLYGYRAASRDVRMPG